MTAMTTHSAPLTLVLCGTGKTGRRLVDRLQQADLPVRIGSRSTTPPFDWEDPHTWAGALAGVEAVYVTYTPDLAFPGAADKVCAFTRMAVDHGVRRLVLLSGRGEEQAEISEATIQNSGADWTVLRCSWFMQNFSESFLHDPVLDGVIALPAGAVVEPFLDVDDIADCAFAALTDPIHTGRLYELTGPEALSFSEIATALSDATGRSIVYVPVTTAKYVQGAIEAGVDPDDAHGFAELFAEVLDGRNIHPMNGVEQMLGRTPQTFAAYARHAASTGIWASTDRPELAR